MKTKTLIITTMLLGLAFWGCESVNEPKEGLTDQDDIPETQENIHNVERGQIWQLGNHRLMCGDSRSKEDVDKLMGGEKADMVFTDPPYGVKYEQGKFTGSKVKKIFKPIANDDKQGKELFLFINDVFHCYDLNTKNGCVFLVLGLFCGVINWVFLG